MRKNSCPPAQDRIYMYVCAPAAQVHGSTVTHCPHYLCQNSTSQNFCYHTYFHFFLLYTCIKPHTHWPNTSVTPQTQSPHTHLYVSLTFAWTINQCLFGVLKLCCRGGLVATQVFVTFKWCVKGLWVPARHWQSRNVHMTLKNTP